MIFSVGMGEQVIADADDFLGLQEAIMVVFEEFAWSFTALIGFNRDRSAVCVGAGDHQNAISFEPMVASEDVSGQEGASQVPNV